MSVPWIPLLPLRHLEMMSCAKSGRGSEMISLQAPPRLRGYQIRRIGRGEGQGIERRCLQFTYVRVMLNPEGNPRHVTRVLAKQSSTHVNGSTTKTFDYCGFRVLDVLCPLSVTVWPDSCRTIRKSSCASA